MTVLEDALRDALAREAAALPAPSSRELAERAIRRAARLRRRQRTGGAVVALLAIALISVSVAALPERRGADPVARPIAVSTAPALVDTRAARGAADVSPPRGDAPAAPQAPARVTRLPADVVADDRLVTVDGGSIDLSFVGTVSQAYRVGNSWLVLGEVKAQNRSSLWYVTTGGRPHALLSGTQGIALSADGHRLAWRTGSELFVGVIIAGRLVNKWHTPVPGSGAPVGFVGNAVLLARGVTGRSGGYDVWWPDRGAYEPTWDNTAAVVYGALSDGRTVVAQVATPIDVADKTTADGTAVMRHQWCLALLDATRALARVKTACGLGLGTRSPGWVSPDGRWLVTDAAGRTVLVNLTTAFAGQPRLVGVGPAMRGGAAWLDKDTVVHATSSGKALVRLQVDQTRARQAGAEQADDAQGGMQRFPVPVPDLPAGAPVLVVPRLA